MAESNYRVGVLGATSVPIMSTMLWFGAGNHVLGGAATMTLCVTAFVVYKRNELDRFAHFVTDWEVREYANHL